MQMQNTQQIVKLSLVLIILKGKGYRIVPVEGAGQGQILFYRLKAEIFSFPREVSDRKLDTRLRALWQFWSFQTAWALLKPWGGALIRGGARNRDNTLFHVSLVIKSASCYNDTQYPLGIQPFRYSAIQNRVDVLITY